MKKHKNSLILLFSILFCLAFQACYKADNFYADLTKTPQINIDKDFSYKNAYFVGDTMAINGKLNDGQNLEIRIGGILASILRVKKIKYSIGTADHPAEAYMEQALIVISKEMLGDQKTVTVNSSGIEVFGPSIDVLPDYDPKGFSKSLTLTEIADIPENSKTLNCVNGKGDVFFFDGQSKRFKHINKSGAIEEIISENKPIELDGVPYDFSYSTVQAGALNPKADHMYLFVDYKLIAVDLNTRKAIVLNKKPDMSQSPYEGKIGNIGLFPEYIEADDLGNLYLGLNDPYAGKRGIAFYEKSSGMVNYIVNPNSGLPGLVANYDAYRFCPADGIIYLISNSSNQFDKGIVLVDLKTKTKIQTFLPSSEGLNYLGGFNTLKMTFETTNTDSSFGFLAQSGQRLTYLAYQKFVSVTPVEQASALPKWLVLNFNQKRSLPLAPGKFDVKGNIFQPTQYLRPRIATKDQLLNYDEEGHLYFTVNGLAKLAKTSLIKS